MGGERGRLVAIGALQLLGCVVMFVPNPLGWMWIGARVYEATGSITADMAVVLAGFLATTCLLMSALNRLDAGRGMLNRIVVASTAVTIVGFHVWYYESGAFLIPFMPTQ